MGNDFPFDRREYERWMGQAEYTIDAAKSDLQSQFYSWACFKCQQAADLYENQKCKGSCYHSQQCVEKGLNALIEAHARRKGRRC